MPKGVYPRKSGYGHERINKEKRQILERQANCKKHLFYLKSSHKKYDKKLKVITQECIHCGFEKKTVMEVD